MALAPFKILILGLLLITLTACLPKPYRVEIPQGNLIDEAKLEKVIIGMEPRQVRYLLGTPLIVDPFNPDRWDYYYSVNSYNGTSVEHHISIFFRDGRVSSIEKII
ncbi:MAG: outer membrane protein assembly factor BamE [Cellvibrionaceae bacterium]|jgi:outer membrane protein assembly factor BamE